MIGARLAARLADLMLANNVPNLGDFGAGFATPLKPGAGGEGVGALHPPSAPIPTFPRKRGKGLRARARGFGCPSQPSLVNAGRAT
jgi:hypothetical protein